MAEGFAKKYFNKYEIMSAGTEPEPVNPNAIIAMNDIGINISDHKSKKIDINKLTSFDLVITLCDDANKKCPIVDSTKHMHWNIPDPAKYKGTDKQIKIEFTKIRNMIYNQIINLKNNFNEGKI